MHNQLVLFAGYSCAGKSTFIELMRNQNAIMIHNHLNYKIKEKYFFSGIRGVKYIRDHYKNIFLHYDLFASYQIDRDFDRARDLIHKSHNVVIATLLSPRVEIVGRVNFRLNEIKNGDYPIKRKQFNYNFHMDKIRMYQSPDFLSYYEKWFEFISQFDCETNVAVHTPDLISWTINPFDLNDARKCVAGVKHRQP